MRVCIVMRVQFFSHHLNPANQKKTWTMRRRFSAGRRRQGVKEITMKSADQNLLHGPTVSKMERLGGWGSRKSLLAEPRLDKFMAKFGTPWFQDSDSKVPPEVPVPRGIQIVFPLMQSDQSVVECLILSFCLWRLNKDLKYPKAARLSKRRPWFPTQDFPSSVFPTTDGSRLVYMIEITATGNAKSAPETTVCLVVFEFLYFTVWGLQKSFRHLCFEWRKVSFLLVFLLRFQPLWRLCWLSVRWNLPDFLCKSVPSHSTREKWQEPAYLAPNVSPLAGAVHLGVPYMTSGSKLFQLVEGCEILILTMDPWILCESQFVLVESGWIFLILFALFTLERWEVSH